MTHFTPDFTQSEAGFFGMDVHQKTIVVAEAHAFGKPHVLDTLKNEPQAVKELFEKARERYEVVFAVYEAGGCGFGLVRQLRAMGISCLVCAPSKLEKAPGHRVKNDKRDACKLARHLQEHVLMDENKLHCVHVPEIEDEALRERTRQRDAFKRQVKTTKNQIMGMLRRHNKHYRQTKTNWNQTYRRWLQRVDFQNNLLQETFLDYLDLLDQLEQRVAQLDQDISEWVSQWKKAEVVKAMTALKGIKHIAAPALVAEIGCFSRFESAPKFMSYLGLTPSEYSSGERVTRGRITKTGNSRVRSLLVEAATSVRYIPKPLSAFAATCPKDLPKEVVDHAYQCQRRLHKKYKRLLFTGKNSNVARVAAARELAGFVWAIGVMMETYLESKYPKAA